MQIAPWEIWAEYTLYASLESSFPFYHLLSWLKPAQNYLIGCSILLYANGYVPADNIYTPSFPISVIWYLFISFVEEHK